MLVERNEQECATLEEATEAKAGRASEAEEQLQTREEEFLSFVSDSAATYNELLQTMEAMEEEIKENKPLVRLISIFFIWKKPPVQ